MLYSCFDTGENTKYLHDSIMFSAGSHCAVEFLLFCCDYFFIFFSPDRLKERLDFMLRESMVGNSYLNALTAHLSYWSSSDVAQYLLLQLLQVNLSIVCAVYYHTIRASVYMYVPNNYSLYNFIAMIM